MHSSLPRARGRWHPPSPARRMTDEVLFVEGTKKASLRLGTSSTAYPQGTQSGPPSPCGGEGKASHGRDAPLQALPSPCFPANPGNLPTVDCLFSRPLPRVTLRTPSSAHGRKPRSRRRGCRPRQPGGTRFLQSTLWANPYLRPAPVRPKCFYFHALFRAGG